MGLTLNLKAFFTAQGILKVIQIILSLIAIGLLRNHTGISFGGFDRQYTGIIAIGSSMLISAPLLIGYVFFDHSNHLLEMLFCLTAAIMNCTGGAFVIEVYHDMNTDNETVKAALAMGSMMIINTLVYLIDAFTGGFYARSSHT